MKEQPRSQNAEGQHHGRHANDSPPDQAQSPPSYNPSDTDDQTYHTETSVLDSPDAPIPPEQPVASPENTHQAPSDKAPFLLNLDQTILPPDAPDSSPAIHAKRRKKYVKEKISPISMILKVVLACSIIAASVGVSVLIILAVQDVMGFSKGTEQIDLYVKPGEGITGIAQRMQDEGLIRSSFLFRSYLRVFVKQEVIVHYGKYSFQQNMSYSDIVKALEESGQSVNVRITIVEGARIEQIAMDLEEKMICTQAAFIDAINHGEWLTSDGAQQFSFMESLLQEPDLDQRPYRLEGYLFPDTYEFQTNTPAEQVVGRFLKNFDRKFDSHMRYLTRQAKYTMDEIMRIASIVEGEASGTDQMARVSSVYWNRLKNPSEFPKMQADPTTRYARDTLTPLGVDDAILEAYDTYKSAGLPMGPINNPGYRAIEAALKPADEDYYFFVTSKDMQTFYFSKTYDKHMENIQKAQNNEPE